MPSPAVILQFLRHRWNPPSEPRMDLDEKFHLLLAICDSMELCAHNLMGRAPDRWCWFDDLESEAWNSKMKTYRRQVMFSHKKRFDEKLIQRKLMGLNYDKLITNLPNKISYLIFGGIELNFESTIRSGQYNIWKSANNVVSKSVNVLQYSVQTSRRKRVPKILNDKQLPKIHNFSRISNGF